MSQASECLSLLDYAGASSFGLRLADLNFAKPTAFTTGLVKGVLQNSVLLNEVVCNLNGGGTFSWLLSFDTVAGTVKTGGASPVANPTTGFAFVDQMVAVGNQQLHVQPVTLTAPLDQSCDIASTSAADIVLPVYLNPQASSAIYVPVRQLFFSAVTVSGDHNCIGTYNAAGLDPANSCLSDAQHPAFLKGGQVGGFINLEDADAIPVTAINQSLCVLLSGNSAVYGDGALPIAKCKRQNGKIIYQGDWCTATNAAATAQCADADLFNGSFAASGVKIN